MAMDAVTGFRSSETLPVEVLIESKPISLAGTDFLDDYECFEAAAYAPVLPQAWASFSSDMDSCKKT